MASGFMHDQEIAVDTTLVRRLLTVQFPEYAHLDLEPVSSAGTVNAIFRLGPEMAVRLPRIAWGQADIEKEYRWLPKIAPFLPLHVPQPIALGEPGAGFPWHWSINRWMEGEDAAVARVHNEKQAATDLARFISALHQLQFFDQAPQGRGLQLSERDGRTQKAIAELHLADPDFDAEITAEIWEACLQTPSWASDPVWTHGDLIPPNLLLVNGRLAGVLDFGDLGVGDPACDLVPAWSFLSARARDHFRAMLQVDDATWARGCGWALSQAVLILPYYRQTNPSLVSVARRMTHELIFDFRRSKLF